MGPMWSSPHKRRRPSTPPVTLEDRNSKLPGSWPYKTSTAKPLDGNKGTRYKKKHERAQQPPGYPQGVCLGPDAIRKGRVCACGTHNRGAK